MTRKDYESVCRVLKNRSTMADCTAQDMRKVLANDLCAAFRLTGDAYNAFMKQAGFTAAVTR
jgi:hypothetical protein